jgi:biotin-(acetyl-CoA carboxylase) ligase
MTERSGIRKACIIKVVRFARQENKVKQTEEKTKRQAFYTARVIIRAPDPCAKFGVVGTPQSQGKTRHDRNWTSEEKVLHSLGVT